MARGGAAGAGEEMGCLVAGGWGRMAVVRVVVMARNGERES